MYVRCSRRGSGGTIRVQVEVATETFRRSGGELVEQRFCRRAFAATTDLVDVIRCARRLACDLRRRAYGDRFDEEA